MMWRIRALEQTALQGLADELVLGAIHPSIGQEAVAVGVISCLETDDLLLSTHRGHGHTLAKGASAPAMMCELLGREGGTCGGKGGSMHIADFSVGMLGANGVVAANIVIAAGAAHAVKLRGENRVVACFFGDGAINRGPFLEGLNWAAVFGLPVLFVCEDNGYAATTRADTMTAGGGASVRARALGITAEEVDGNDVLAVSEAAARLVGEIRAGLGPRFLHARTWRITGHTGADPAAYRSQAEVERYRDNDPLARARDLLVTAGVAAADLDGDRAAAEAEMLGAYQYAKAAPFPPASVALTDVQDVGAP
jgi:pyruvate dehydrogenase E1 component alpha subunit